PGVGNGAASTAARRETHCKTPAVRAGPDTASNSLLGERKQSRPGAQHRRSGGAAPAPHDTTRNSAPHHDTGVMDMSRRHDRALMLGAAALCASLLGACSSASSPAASSGPVTLTFWGTYGNGGNTIIPAFEKANPGIKIQYVDIPYDSMLQKLTTGAAGGQLPDLVRADLGWV